MYKQCIDRSVGDETGFVTQSDCHTAVLVYDSTRQRLNFNALMASSPRRDVVGSLIQAAKIKILTLGSGLAARQNTPAIDAAIYRLNGTLYQL